MITNSNPYYIMDSHLEGKVHHALIMAITMAKASYPHLVGEMEMIESLYREKLEGFTGTQNKPVTKLSYSKKEAKK